MTSEKNIEFNDSIKLQICISRKWLLTSEHDCLSSRMLLSLSLR